MDRYVTESLTVRAPTWPGSHQFCLLFTTEFWARVKENSGVSDWRHLIDNPLLSTRRKCNTSPERGSLHPPGPGGSLKLDHFEKLKNQTVQKTKYILSGTMMY